MEEQKQAVADNEAAQLDEEAKQEKVTSSEFVSAKYRDKNDKWEAVSVPDMQPPTTVLMSLQIAI